jgi:hypothetical protein
MFAFMDANTEDKIQRHKNKGWVENSKHDMRYHDQAKFQLTKLSHFQYVSFDHFVIQYPDFALTY